MFSKKSVTANQRDMKWVMMSAVLFLTAISLGGSQSAVAGELSLVVNGVSSHMGPNAEKREYNEQNWGSGLQYDFDLLDKQWMPYITVGGFSDSNKKPSYYAGGGVMHRSRVFKDRLNFDVGGLGFVMAKQNVNNGYPFVGVLPVVALGGENVALNVTYIPDVATDGVSLWFFQLKISANSLTF